MEDLREGIRQIVQDANDKALEKQTWGQFKDYIADNTITYLKANGVVRLAENQDLPIDFCQDIIDKYGGKVREDAGSYKRSQQDILKANFRRVEELI